jgi:hypothetical protein
MKRIIPGFVLLLAIGCSQKSSEEKIDVKPVDSTGIVDKSVAASFDERTFKELNLPLIIDTNFIMEVDTNDRIPYQQVRQLGTNVLKNDVFGGITYDLNSFCEIDSLKQEDMYNAYLEKLDIGMTKIAISFKVGVIKYGNNSRLFIWGVHNSSYEACPFFGGTTLIGTFVNSKNQNVHFVIGELSAGGDPPSMGNDEVTARLEKDGTIKIHSLSVTDDLDVPGDDRTEQWITLKIENDEIKIVDSKKENKNTKPATE